MVDIQPKLASCLIKCVKNSTLKLMRKALKVDNPQKWQPVKNNGKGCIIQQ